MKTTILPALLAAALLPSSLFAQLAPQEVTTEIVASGLGRPLLVTYAPGDFDRLFVVDKFGTLKIVDRATGAVNSTPFLNLAGQVSGGSEQGLLGKAFHPDYANNGWVFINYTDPAGNTKIDRYTVSAANPDVLNPASKQNFLSVSQPYSNHNGGMVTFGPDGYLYIGMGDGGSGGDPGNRAQSGNTLLGKILRLDVDQYPYTSPPTNMGVQDPAMLDEIWAIGIRNPWRFEFDRATGDLFIADVGQNLWEEIHVVEASRYLGQTIDLNFGWRLMEGNHCYNPSSNCNTSGLLELPVFEFVHGGSPFRCSITGGNTYAGRTMARMHGYYFFSDYCSGEVLLIHENAGNWVFQNVTAQAGNLGSVVGFGEDAEGEVYVCVASSIRRIVPKGFQLEIPRLVAGQSAVAFIEGGTPFSQFGLGYSLAGIGSTSIPPFGVIADLAAPQQLFVGTLNFAGGAAVPGNVPLSLQNQTIWFQAAEPGSTTNVVVDTVQ